MVEIYTIFKNSFVYGKKAIIFKNIEILLFNLPFINILMKLFPFCYTKQMIHNLMIWYHRLKWPSNMAFIRNEFIKGVVDHIS